MAINRYNTPAEQNLMETYVPLPFQEMNAAAQLVQGRHDQGEAIAESLDDNILNITPKRELDKRVVNDYLSNLDTELQGLITKHDGRYADMVHDLKFIKKRVDRDMKSGQLSSIVTSGTELPKYTEGVISTKEDEKYDPYLDSQLGAGAERSTFMSEGMVNIGTEAKPNYVIDENYYQNSVIGQPLSSYKYTGVWQASDMQGQAKDIFGVIKPDSRELTYDQVQPDGSTRTITEKIKNISPSKIAQASMSNISVLSNNAKTELNLWSSQLEDELKVDYADDFIRTLLFDQMQSGNPAEVNKQYNELLSSLYDADGNLTPQADAFAQMWKVNEMGQKYIKGETTLKDVESGAGKYKTNKINQTNKYKIIDVGQGPEGQYIPVIDSDGVDISTYEGDQLLHKWQDATRYDFTNYEGAVTEYNKFLEQTPNDIEHLEELMVQVEAARYDYESGAFTRQMVTQQAAINANYKYNKGAGTEPGDITHGINNDLLPTTYEDSGILNLGSSPMSWNIDVIFDKNGFPVDPSDRNTIMAHIRNRTMYNSDGLPTGFKPSGLGNDDIYVDGMLDPSTVDYTGQRSTVYDASYYGNTPLDQEKVRLYNKNKKTLFGGRTRSVTQLSGTGDKSMDNTIAEFIPENWLNTDFTFGTHLDDGKFSMNENPGAGVTSLSSVIADINGDGKADQSDVLELIENVKKGDKKIMWESTPNSRIGSYRGIVQVPLAEGGQQALFFKAPQAYTNEIMNNGMDQNGYYGPLNSNAKNKKQSIYHAQMDLDRAIRQAGNVVPSGSVNDTGNPVGYYYFGINPSDGSPLRSDEYIFVPSRNTILSADVVEGEIVYKRSTGDNSDAQDVDDNTTDLGRIIVLNDPKHTAIKEFWEDKMDLTDPEKEETKNNREFVPDNSGSNFSGPNIDNTIGNINNINNPNIINRKVEQEDITELEPADFNSQAFKEKFIEAQTNMDLISPEESKSIVNMDTYESEDFGTLVPPSGTGGSDALVITQPGDEVFPQGAIMADDYRIWNLTTGEQLDRDGNVIGEREFDHYMYKDNNNNDVHVDFSALDSEQVDPNITPGAELNPDGTPIVPEEIINPGSGGIEIPKSGAPNTIVSGPQTFNTEMTLKNGNMIKGNFNVRPGQVWFDDSFNSYASWSMHRGNQLVQQEMQVKQQLLDQFTAGEDVINKDLQTVFKRLYGNLGDGVFSGSMDEYQDAEILGLIQDDGTTTPFDKRSYENMGSQGPMTYSDNYDPRVHNEDGSLRPEFAGGSNQILNGNFPSLQIFSDMEVTLGDGTTTTLDDAIRRGNMSIMMKSGVANPHRSGTVENSQGRLFNIPLADVWRSYDSQNVAYEAWVAGGKTGDPVAPPSNSFHVAGQAFDLSQDTSDYGIYLVDLSNSTVIGSIGNQKMELLDSTNGKHFGISLDNLVQNGIKPYSGMSKEIQKLVTQRLINLNKKDGYSLAQLSAGNPDSNEWWHFSIGEMTSYREPLMPGNIYGTYKFVK